MNKIKSHADLLVWQKSMDLVVSLYQSTNRLPDSEKYGLTSQIRRAGVSVASNIAEGRSRGTNNEFKRFLYIAYASAKEVQTQLEICYRLEFIANETNNILQQSTEEICKMIYAMIRTIKVSKSQVLDAVP